MLKEFVQYLVEIAKPEIFSFDDRNYSSRSLSPIHVPRAKPLVVNSLTGLIDLVKPSPIEGMPSLLVHVVDHNEVHFISDLESDWMDRHHFVKATTANHSDRFQFGKYLSQDEFIIGLQSMFVETDWRTKVLQAVGTIKTSAVDVSEDDGITQQVETAGGVHLVNKATDLPNPVALKPFRTFLEIEQPESKFILRVRKSKFDKGIEVGLFEADGGAWKMEAIQSIKSYLSEKLQDVLIIA